MQEPTTQQDEMLRMQGSMLKRSGYLLWKSRYFRISTDPIPLEKLADYYKRNFSQTGQDDDGNQTSTLQRGDILKNIAHAAVSGRGLLVYYENPDADEPLGIIDLTETTGFERVRVFTRPNSFSINCKNGKKIVLSVESKKEMKKWLKTLILNRGFCLTMPVAENPKNSSKYQEIYQALLDSKADEIFSRASETVDQDARSETAETMITHCSEVAEKAAEATSLPAEVEQEIPAVVSTPQVEPQPQTLMDRIWTLLGFAAPDSTTNELNYTKPDGTILSGWLLKRSDYLKKWNRRYFVLHKNSDGNLVLGYYRPSNAKLSQFAGKLECNAETRVQFLQNIPQQTHAFMVKSGVQTYILAAENQELVSMWFNNIHPVSVQIE